jgi:hypothetical protein
MKQPHISSFLALTCSHGSEGVLKAIDPVGKQEALLLLLGMLFVYML